MKWEDVRKQYPNTFVKFQVVESHIEEHKEIVDTEVAIDDKIVNAYGLGGSRCYL